MASLRRIALLGAVALLPSAAALAADMDGYYEETGVPYEFGSGWYLRGDIGYKFYNAPTALLDVEGYGAMTDEALSSTAVGGVGFGYQFSDYFRMDATVDYEWPGHFTGQLYYPSEDDPGYSQESADISAWTGLINAYIDLGNWGGFTPYVGGGIGASYLTTTNVHEIHPDKNTADWTGDSEWNLAWALTAGASYAISRNWLVDVNYRYVDLGDAQSAETDADHNYQRFQFNDISAHEVRVGVRYKIN